MNRREALQSGLGILTAASIDGEVATVSPRNPQAFVITSKKLLSSDAILKMKAQWSEIFRGTEYANVPVVVMVGGMELSVIDQVE